MYCVKCGVQLADTEQKCPLCETVVYHPDISRPAVQPLYPVDRLPKKGSAAKALSGAVLILFVLPLLIGLYSDLHADGQLDWYGYMAGGVALGYVLLPLPLWFRHPNPVIFVPCDFAAVLLYVFYVARATGGAWFMTFALPVIGTLAVIISALVALMRYVKKGRLYMLGGGSIALGGWLWLMEYTMTQTFGLPFIGWSLYPLMVLAVCGCLLIYLAINRVARDVVARKLFF